MIPNGCAQTSSQIAPNISIETHFNPPHIRRRPRLELENMALLDHTHLRVVLLIVRHQLIELSFHTNGIHVHYLQRCVYFAQTNRPTKSSILRQIPHQRRNHAAIKRTLLLMFLGHLAAALRMSFDST